MSSNSISLGVNTGAQAITKPLQTMQADTSAQKSDTPKTQPAQNKEIQSKADAGNTKGDISKSDVLVIAGKEIKKKDAITYGGALAAGIGTIATAGFAFKKGRIINGENSKFFSNISEGLKAMFTKTGKEKYKKALENIANNAPDTVSTAGKGKKHLFNRKNKGKVQNTPQTPVPTREEIAKDLIEEYNKGDKEAQKIVKDIVNNAQKRTIKENVDKIYKKLEPEVADILGDDFKDALIKAQQKGNGSITGADTILRLGKEFSTDELKTIMASKDGAKKLVEYVQTEQVLSDAANASKKLLQSIINS